MAEKFRCEGITKKGIRCRRKVNAGLYCHQHAPELPCSDFIYDWDLPTKRQWSVQRLKSYIQKKKLQFRI